MLDDVVDFVDCATAGAAELSFPESAVPPILAAARELVLELVDVEVEVVETLEMVMAIPLPAGAVAFRRTFVHRRPLNVVTEDDIQMAAV